MVRSLSIVCEIFWLLGSMCVSQFLRKNIAAIHRSDKDEHLPVSAWPLVVLVVDHTIYLFSSHLFFALVP